MRLSVKNGIVTAWVLALFLPAVARAEDAGLPQMDMSLFPEQLFWLAITFIVLYVLMSFVALPRVAVTQDNRKKAIASEIEAARAANESAQATVAKVEKDMADARAKAQADVNEMIAKANQETNTRQAEQERELMRRLNRAEADIAVTREAALNAVKQSAGDLAAVIVERAISGRRAA